MKYIKKFNESIREDVFKLTNEDIEDICLEMTDSGFNIRIIKTWINNGVRSKEPLKNKSIPAYEINLVKPEEKCSSDKNRRNGYYLDELSTLKMFMSILNRLESYGNTYYYISDCRYHISLHLEEVETGTGFDFNIFNQELGTWFDTLRSNYSGLGSDPLENLFYLNNQFRYTEGFSGHKLCSYGITTKIDKQEITDILNKLEQNTDNKESYNDFINLFNKKISKYSKYIDFNIEYNLVKTYKYNKKTGVFSKKELEYSLYEIIFRIKQKS